MSLKIAIIGAGPAGCMLARLLLRPQETEKPRAAIEVTIYEAENGLDFRSQGGTLDLHEGNGLRAMKAAGLLEEFQKFARYDGEAFKIADKDLLCYIKMNGSDKAAKDGTGRPEIDRPQLRKLLFDSLPGNTVVWGHKLHHLDPATNTLHFTNGNTATGFDLIVGADGAWSKVRNVLTTDKPYFSGIAGHSALVLDVANKHPDIHELVNRGSVFSLYNGKTIFAQYMSDGSVNITTWAQSSPDWQSTCGYDVHNAAEIKAAARHTYADWHPTLRKMVQVADDSTFVPRDLYMLPVGATWEHVRGSTLIGDAAHLMTPFAGEGVNLALEDSLELARRILKSSSADELDANVHAYEQEMFPRVKGVQEDTFANLTAMFLTPGTPRTAIEAMVCTSLRSEVGPIGMWFVKPLVFAYFFFFKLLY